MTGTKLYSQIALRDADGNFTINQFAEVAHRSGLIVPQHVGTATVTSPINNRAAVTLMDIDEIFHYEPDLSKFRKFPIMPVVEPRQTRRFCIEPHDARVFSVLSSRTIAEAYKALTFQGISPDIDYNAILKDDGEIDEDDHRMIDAVAKGVGDIISGVDDQGQLPNGQYL